MLRMAKGHRMAAVALVLALALGFSLSGCTDDKVTDADMVPAAEEAADAGAATEGEGEADSDELEQTEDACMGNVDIRE